MEIPDKLPINRMEDYQTEYLGQIKDGRLFWGYETFVYSIPHWEIKGSDKLKYRTDYSVLRIFDGDGNLLQTKYKSANAANKLFSTTSMLEEMVSEIGEVEYNDIEVKLFEVLIDGIAFGLIPDYGSGVINLQPGSLISFQEPWDGEYYT